MKGKIKNVKGITLIALVITIIVLLILAGVSIAALGGQNGILNNATEAKKQSEIGDVKDQARLDINAKQVEKLSPEITDEELEEILVKYGTLKGEGDILDKTLVTKNGYEILVREIWNGTTTGNNDGGEENVKITISKTPETELSGKVILKVEKVEGIDGIDLNSIDTSKLSETEKKELIKKIDLFGTNTFAGTNYKNIEELIEERFNGNEQEFWEYIGNYDDYLKETIEYLKDENIEFIDNYEVINPKGDISNEYVATENGKYTFKVKDLNTGKIYTETIDVNNIDKSLQLYYIDSGLSSVYLLDRTGKHVDFEEAYIIYEGERINLESCIDDYRGYKSVGIADVARLLVKMGKIEDKYDVAATTQKFELVINGESYFADIKMEWAE